MLSFLIGLFIGCFIGVTVMCCLFVAKEADEEIIKTTGNEDNQDEQEDTDNDAR